MNPRQTRMLAFRSALILSLALVALLPTTPEAGEGLHETALGFLPALLALVATLFGAEVRPAWRPLRGVAWVLVFDLTAIALVVAALGERLDPYQLGFLLLGAVVATSRDRLGGSLAGGLAGAGFLYLAWRHGVLAVAPLTTASMALILLGAGVFTGLLSREAEEEREDRTTQTAELREQLVDLGDHLRNVLSCVASGVLAVDEAGRVTTYNRTAERVLGLPAHKVLGRPLGEVAELGPQLGPLFQQAQPLPGGEGAPRPDLEFVRPGGERCRIGYALTPLENVAGRRLGWILVFQDVSLIRDYEARMLAQEQLAALGRLVSGIAHEFGNLLGGAKGHVDLALASADPEEAREALPVVQRTLARALETIEHLLRFARGTPLHRVPGVRLEDVLERALELMGVELEARGVEVERVGAPTAELCADAAQLEQAFLNIIINASQAMHDRPRRVLRIGLEPGEGQTVRAVFEDTGPGVPEELRGRIFEPFVTTKGALGGSEVPGTGLGLATALGIVAGHEGTIEVGSSPELGGARFVVTLPTTA